MSLPWEWPPGGGGGFGPGQGAAFYTGTITGETRLSSITWESALNTFITGSWVDGFQVGITRSGNTWTVAAPGVYQWWSFCNLIGDATHYAWRLRRAGVTLVSIGSVAPSAQVLGNLYLHAIVDLRTGGLSFTWEACRANFGAPTTFVPSASIDGETYRVANVAMHRIG